MKALISFALKVCSSRPLKALALRLLPIAERLLNEEPFVLPGLVALQVPLPVNAAQDPRPIRKSANVAKVGCPSSILGREVVMPLRASSAPIRKLCLPCVQENWSAY